MSHSQESSGMPIEEYNIINIKIHLLEEKKIQIIVTAQKKNMVKIYKLMKKNPGWPLGQWLIG